MPRPDVIKDLTDMINAAIQDGEAAQAVARSETAFSRYIGRIEGLQLVQEWLRKYEP